MHALSAIRMERMCGAPSLFLAAQFEIIVQLNYFFRDPDSALSVFPSSVEIRLW